MHRFTPLFDGVLVKRAEAQAKTKTGLFLPESAQEKSDTAVVVAAGPGKLDRKNRRVPLTVKVGDHVILGRWSGEELELEGVKHLVVREADILGIVES
jgi:chaperonin GroES